MSDMKKIFDRIDGCRDEIIQIQTELTSRVALGPDNGGSGEHEKAEYARVLLKALDPDVMEQFNAPDERARDGYRPNIVARWSGRKSEPNVWVLSHSDIVPPGDLSLWTGDPYKVRVDGDRVIGRGVIDNQHGFVSSYLAMKAIRETGEALVRPVSLAFVADEETGSEYGLIYLLKNHADLFAKNDLIIVPDGGDEEGINIEIAEKSMLWIRFTVIGHQCHASTPEKGNNSLVGMSRLIIALGQLKEKFSISDELFDPSISTFEPTKVEPNVPNINTIPGMNVFHLDCRILPRYQVGEVFSYAKEIAAKIANDYDLKIEAEACYWLDAAEPTSPDAPVVKALAKAIKRVKGKDARPVGIGGGTVAAFFRKAGFPAVVWNTGFDSAHQPDEYCPISDTMTDAKIFASIYMED
ncbi:MAG: M20 family metallo-hydrolase [Deltaproteobacteria bacterium]|nr:M20 family metallo-hydrolase [Deltaproteobacteria bacterium]